MQHLLWMLPEHLTLDMETQRKSQDILEDLRPFADMGALWAKTGKGVCGEGGLASLHRLLPPPKENAWTNGICAFFKQVLSDFI